MNIVTRQMGFTFVWLHVNDLGGFSESEFSSIFEKVNNEYSNLPPAYQDYILKWVEATDKLAKAGINLPFADMGLMFIEEMLKQNKYLGITGLNTVISELNSLVNKTNGQIAKSLIDNKLP